MVQASYSPVSPIDPEHPALPLQDQDSTEVPQGPHALPSPGQKAAWLPFTLQWYYLTLPATTSLCLGVVLIVLVWYSERHNGLGTDNGSSAVLFGWRFTPTVVAVLYVQMTVILFEDLKRTEPFYRLARASPGGASAYGTVLQSPRAWWSIFADVCLRRKRTGKTSLGLICAAIINVVALLAISPLSSALLTSEEISITRSIEFARLMPMSNASIPAIATRETYFRTLSALTRNVSTSAWVTDNSLTFPFWPSSEVAQLGPDLVSPYNAWSVQSTTVRSEYHCQEMTLESAEMSNKRYSQVYSVQQYGPYNGTQPMVTYVLKSGDGCRYELSVHPSIDIASAGGVTWSNASTFFPTTAETLTIGGLVIAPNVTSTHMFARLNVSEECNGRDIIIMSTAWAVALNQTEIGPFIPKNQTYERSPGFRMRGLLCGSQYYASDDLIPVALSTSSQNYVQTKSQVKEENQRTSSIINITQFEALSMRNDWKTYFDSNSMIVNARRVAEMGSNASLAGKAPQFSGMAPVLAVLSDYNITAMLNNPDIAKRAARIKGRFLTETLREAFSAPEFVQADHVTGNATLVEERVIVLAEIGYTLAALFFVSTILLIVVYSSSRLRHRPLNLSADPASIIGLSLLIRPQFARASTFRSMHSDSRSDFYATLQREKYLTSSEALVKGSKEYALVSPNAKAKPDWRPHVIRVRMLFALCFWLMSVMAAILTLSAFSTRSLLSQAAFVYEADVSKLKLSFPTFAPISIAPTVISIVIGIWWDQVDATFRVLQPFISMTRRPTPINAGAGLTYRSKTWIGAAFKAGRYKHWVLFMVTVGSILAQVLTVSMSALFEKQTTSEIQHVTLSTRLQIRQDPLISEVEIRDGDREIVPPQKVLNELYLDASKNWLYGAGLQHSFNNSRLPWTFDGWSFLPLDLSSIANISNITNVRLSSPTDADASIITSTNASFVVPAIRARLDCAEVPELSNTSAWIQPAAPLSFEDLVPEALTLLNKTRNMKRYILPAKIFEGTEDQSSILSTPNHIMCCANGTISKPQKSVVGYWSATIPKQGQSKNGATFPYANIPWPLSIMPKWIVGKSISVPRLYRDFDLLYEEIPQIQAARCRPTIESAQASVLIDLQTKLVYSYTIEGPTTQVDSAWADVFRGSELANITYYGPLNITTSLGVLFLDALLGSANRRSVVITTQEDLTENAFVIRDQERGLNMDLMTSSMYAMANKDPEALLNYTTLVEYADRTFQTFFQHFVNSGFSLTGGGYAYQPIGKSGQNTSDRVTSDRTASVLGGDNSIAATTSRRIRVLHMNTVATYLAVSILIWLFGTTIIIMCVQRKYLSSMIRDVHLIADMLVLIAGSDNLLELVQQKGITLKSDHDIKTMLGWFKDRDGETRWGVEVVGGRDAVEWVDAPKVGWHVHEKSSLDKRLFPWKANELPTD